MRYVRGILHSKAKKNPETLLHLLVTIALTSITVILILTGFGIHRIYSQHIIDNAEEDAVSISEAIAAEEQDRFMATGPDGRTRLVVEGEAQQRLDRHLRNFLRPFNIVKIKIYAADRTIVYSTDTTVIGRVDANNARLRNALSGNNDSKLEKKEEVRDLADERKFDVDVVETYVPLRDRSNRIIGSFEIYEDVTKYRHEIRQVVASTVLIMALILSFVFALSYLLIRKGAHQLRESQETLERIAITDGLTGIFNRRHVLERAGEEFTRLARDREKGAPAAGIGFIMIDIDHFKQINDSHGHFAGDDILQEVARRITSSIRPYDMAGRYGGEEFIVVLPGAEFEQVRVVADRIRDVIREQPFRVEGSAVAITVSLGIAFTQGEEDGYAETLKRADRGLYKAKNSGRDRVGWV